MSALPDLKWKLNEWQINHMIWIMQLHYTVYCLIKFHCFDEFKNFIASKLLKQEEYEKELKSMKSKLKKNSKKLEEIMNKEFEMKKMTFYNELRPIKNELQEIKDRMSLIQRNLHWIIKTKELLEWYWKLWNEKQTRSVFAKILWITPEVLRSKEAWFLEEYQFNSQKFIKRFNI